MGLVHFILVGLLAWASVSVFGAWMLYRFLKSC
jgi:hypothetical protein